MSAPLPRWLSAVLAAQRVAFAAFATFACSSGAISVGDDRTPDSGAAGATAADPNPSQLLALLGSCTQVSSGLLAPEAGRPADIRVCALSNAVFWVSELAVDCDGERTAICNSQQDPQYQATTVGKDSAGNSLDASVVPYVEVPATGTAFDYHAAGLSMGSVAAVIYRDRLAYGVIGHEQASGVIGAASYAMAALLGIDPNPVSGGLQSEVVRYLAFTGPNNVVPALEDGARATALGKAAASELVATGH
jgi:hypothetical protein